MISYKSNSQNLQKYILLLSHPKIKLLGYKKCLDVKKKIYY